MRSSNIAYLPKLDHLRFLAAVLVFLFHYLHFYFFHWQAQPDKPFLSVVVEGHTGVGLFFTLSGFLFMLIGLSNEVIDYKRFIFNRILRIFPLFLVVFFVAISVGREAFTAADWGYVFFSNLGQAPTSNSFITGAAWTISIEFTFYLVFPFLALFVRQTGLGYLLRLIGLMLLFKVSAYFVIENPIHVYYSTLLGRFDQFLIGMLLACVYNQYGHKLRRYGRLLIVLASLMVFTNSIAQGRWASFFDPNAFAPFWVIWSLLESFAWGALILGWLSVAWSLPSWLERWIQRGGEISYSFYLLHGMVILLTYQWLGQMRPTGFLMIDAVILMVPVFVMVWGVAVLSYETIEKPFLGLRRRYGSVNSEGERKT